MLLFSSITNLSDKKSAQYIFSLHNIFLHSGPDHALHIQHAVGSPLFPQSELGGISAQAVEDQEIQMGRCPWSFGVIYFMIFIFHFSSWQPPERRGERRLLERWKRRVWRFLFTGQRDSMVGLKKSTINIIMSRKDQTASFHFLMWALERPSWDSTYKLYYNPQKF